MRTSPIRPSSTLAMIEVGILKLLPSCWNFSESRLDGPFHGPAFFNFQAYPILSRRLRELEKAGMMTRMKQNPAPRLVRWAMTEKGIDILPAIIRLIVFGARWHTENPFHGKLPRRIS